MLRKYFLSVIFTLSVTFSMAIDYWQPYPITAVVTTNGWEYRIECTVYDSLLGSWQYYNSPWIETAIIDLKSNNTGVIAFNTYQIAPVTDPGNRDSIFGYIIYDQEIHLFKPVYHSHQNYFYGADIAAGSITVNYYIRAGIGTGYHSYDNYTRIYDINNHAWSELLYVNVPGEFNSVWPLPQFAESKLGTFAAADWYDADDYFWNSIGTILV